VSAVIVAEKEALYQSYEEKTTYLKSYFVEVGQHDFYRDLFPVGSFERKGCYEDGKPNGLALDIHGKGKAYHHHITDELSELDDLNGCDFVIISPVGYFGRRRTAANARYLYALTFDLDGVEMSNLRDLLFQMKNNVIPTATYIVNSGTGLHLYYIFDEPIPLYSRVQKKLKEFKYALTGQLWNPYTSIIKEPQRQGIMQGFRMVGSPSRLGKDYPVVAFSVGGRVTLDELNDYIPDYYKAARVTDIFTHSGLSLIEAEQKYPEWYYRRVLCGEKKGQWTVKRALYDWWKQRLVREINVGHRYFGIFTLAIYAIKCGISEDELRGDAYQIMERFDSLSETPDNRFTEDDVVAALEVYNESYVTFPRDDIAKLSGMSIKVNKRNGRKQGQHLRLARGQLAILKDMGEASPGRPSARQTVEDYIRENPEARKCDIIRALGLSKMTVYKYYDEFRRAGGARHENN